MEMAIYRDGRAFALGVVGAATVLATLAGEFLMHNPAQAQDWHACLLGGCRNNSAEVSELPLPATSVTLLNGSMLNITLYQVIVLTLGAVILVGALACAVRIMRAAACACRRRCVPGADTRVLPCADTNAITSECSPSVRHRRPL